MNQGNNGTGNTNNGGRPQDNNPWIERSDPWATPPPVDGLFQASQQTVWRERERRQRTVRSFMMFLFLLMLLEDEPPPNMEEGSVRVRRRGIGGGPPQRPASLEPRVWQARQKQDERLQFTTHSRFQSLIEQNDGRNVAQEVNTWASAQVAAISSGKTPPPISHDGGDETAAEKVWHYPWNVTGLFLGQWQDVSGGTVFQSDRTTKSNIPVDTELTPARLLEKSGGLANQIGVHFLPKPIQVRDDHNFTSLQWDRTVVDGPTGRLLTPEEDAANQNPFWKRQQLQLVDKRENSKVPLTQSSGHVTMRLFTRSIPALYGLSIVDGSVLIQDHRSAHFSPSNDVIVRVRGVLLHAIGKLSLVSSSAPVTHSALILPNISSTRRLTESLGSLDLPQLRDQVWAELGPDLQNWVDQNDRRLQNDGDGSVTDGWDDGDGSSVHPEGVEDPDNGTVLSEDLGWSDVILPYPYTMDDSEESLRQGRSGASRRFRPQERLSETNGAHCQFEMDFQVQSEEWTVGEWRTLIRRKLMEKERLRPDREVVRPAQKSPEGSATEPYANRHWPVRSARRRRAPPQDEALVMVLNGTIQSDTCSFMAQVNATAWRTNPAVVTSRAMNYSFYMMLVCLGQIVVLLRQLVHSQSQSAATRVSLVGVGWQTVLDGLMCLAHIYFSLFLNSLFTPFASVAFFKLLIFCVIEMKYMAIIISARNSANGGQTTEVLRRQVAVLHLRYYVALFGSLVLLFYASDTFTRRMYFLVLYSFWVPQIVLNIITQAKTALHKHYIYGMSLSRMIAPLYIFCVKNSFLHEVYPDVPYDPVLGQLLILWVGIQTAILWGQSKYGTRFLIPSCFLPPKFDYSRPIPTSMLPPDAIDMHTDPMQDETRVVVLPEVNTNANNSKKNDSANTSDHHTTSMTTRLRRAVSTSPITATTTETHSPPRPGPTLDCCICYDPIDIRNRAGYMLAPCDHLFHRSCLMQWMDVKMECPICRNDLPSL